MATCSLREARAASFDQNTVHRSAQRSRRFMGVGVWWGVSWLKSKIKCNNRYPENVRLHDCMKTIVSLGDNSMIDGICLHPVYMAKKTKTCLKAYARKPAFLLVFFGGASLIRTGDLRIMMPRPVFWRCLDVTRFCWLMLDIVQ